MPNWDDQFDFDDIEDNKKKPKPNNKLNDKKANNYDQQFFDHDQMNKKRQSKSILPTINSRNSAKIKPVIQQGVNKVNPFANKSFGSKQIQKDDYEQYDYQQIDDQIPNKKQSNKVISTKQINNKKVQKQSVKIISKQIKKNKSEVSQQQYNEQFVQQQVDQPFNESIKNNKSSKSNNANNINTNKQTKQQNNIDKKYYTENKNLSISNKLNQNINKNKPMLKQQQQHDQYQQQFDNDQYLDDDFEDQSKSPQKNIMNNKLNNNNKLQTKPATGLKLNIGIPQIGKPIQDIKNKIAIKTNNLTSVDKPIVNNNKQPHPRSQSVVPPKPPLNEKKLNKQIVVSNRNINKIQSHSVSKPLKRSNSKQSIRSNGQKSIKASRISHKNQSQYFPNKHIDMVSKSFPHDQDKLNILSQIQINKINQKMRAMIRKFNDQLNDLINKNMLLLKNKSLDRQQTVDQRVRQLQIQKKSGQTAIQVMYKDFDKLQGREGQLKQQEYQLILQKQIQQKKTQIKQAAKQITNMKRDVDSKGKKLSVKQAQQRNAQNIHHLKTILIQTKKDQQKGDQKIQKLTSAHQQLQTKISDMDYKLDQLISQAKQKGVNIQNTQQIHKKHQQLKNKIQTIKNYHKKSQNLISTKIDILNHQNQQIKIMIKNINSQVSNLYGSIDHSQSQAIKLIEKAKEKQGINPLFAQNLDKLAKQIEESRAANSDYYEVRSQVKSRRSDSTKNKSIKNQTQQSIEKSMPLRVTQSQNRLIQNQQQALVKPKFLKKKPGQEHKLDIQNKSQVNERVWNEEEQVKNKTPKNNQNRRSVQDIPTKDFHKQKNQIIEQQKKDKSKPFMLKKNKIGDGKAQQNQQKSIQQSPIALISQKVKQQITLPNQLNYKQDTKKQQTPNINIAPRLMRFGRKKNDEAPSQNNIALNENSKPQKQFVINKQQEPKYIPPSNKNQGIKLEIPQVQKSQQEKSQQPIFVPKRFNLRNKADKKDDSYAPSVQKDNSYVSSAQNSNENTQKSQPSKQQTKEDYKPKFDFKSQEFKIKQQIPIKKQIEKPSEELQIKPKFNLRLRDRMNKNNQQEQTYAPNIGSINKNINGDINFQADNKKNEIKIQNKVNQPKKEIFVSKETNVSTNKQSTQNNPYNPYAPKQQISTNALTKKIEIKKDNSPAKIQNTNPINPVNNPYAAKFTVGQNEVAINQGPKKERGPLKKNKISTNVPKQSFNIYAQADDITNEVKQIGGVKTANQNVYESAVNQPSKGKNEELNINEMLGIKKQIKKNDFDDLLGDIGGVNVKSKKKNNDFFNDLQF